MFRFRWIAACGASRSINIRVYTGINLKFRVSGLGHEPAGLGICGLGYKAKVLEGPGFRDV